MKLFDPPCRNTEICPPWKSCLECEWRVCVSSTDALVMFISFVSSVDHIVVNIVNAWCVHLSFVAENPSSSS